jgi:molybdate transport system substrate-binding protein
MSRSAAAWLAPVALAVASCRGPQGAPQIPTVTVFAAASMGGVMDEIVDKFEAGHDAEVVVSYGGSAALARQILAGAEPGIFVSANLHWADEVSTSRTVARRENRLGNGLVLVVPSTGAADVKTVDDLTGDRVRQIAMGDPDSVPAGTYAREALKNLGLWDALANKLVRAYDVRQALLYVERAEVDAGVVYSTDATASDKVRVVASLDDALSSPVRYAFILFEPTDDVSTAFFDYLMSSDALRVFNKAGFR